MYLRFPNGCDKALTLSYDDGVIYDKKLIEIMNRYGLKGTFNVNSGLYFPENSERSTQDERLTLSEAKKLYINSGHEVAVHTVTHPYLPSMRDEDIINEIIEDRKHIEENYCTLARGGAYPFGVYDERIISILKSCGICYCRTVNSSYGFDLPENWLAFNPTCRHKDKKLMELAEKFIEGSSYGQSKLFYLWGHSYEFHRNDNWDIIENFAEYTGNRNDIWYATNIEIYDYVNCYNNLQISWDKRIIHNPSAIDVWVYIDNEVLKITAGTTVVR